MFAKKSVRQIVEHTTEVIGSLERKPAVIGHSLGGLFTQMIAGRGLAAAAVAIDPAQFRGVLPLPLATVRSVLPVVGNPLNLGRAVYLTLDQFKYSWANELSDEEAEEVHETYHVPGAGVLDLRGGSCSSRRRGHSLTIDHGWREIAEKALAFVTRFV